MGKPMSKIEHLYKEQLLDYERDIADLIQIIEKLTIKLQQKQINTKEIVKGLKYGSN